MMKIAIISINRYTTALNFASVLHSYVFQKFLETHGVGATILDYMPLFFDHVDLAHPGETLKKRNDALMEQLPYAADEEERAKLNKQIRDNEEKIADWESIYREREIRFQKIHDFVEKRYNKTARCYTSDLLEVMDPGFDCYICATDVIWKNERNTGFDRAFFLASKAMEGKGKIAYSAGRGPRGAKTAAQKELFFHYLQDMDAISVRESSLKEYIEQNSELKAQHVLDPVLLQDASFYRNIAVLPDEGPYVLLYYVMEKAEDTIKQAVAYAARHRLPVIEITDRPIREGHEGCRLRYGIGVEEWLGYIQNAECIFTNSFHCACLSIIYEKKFYTGIRRSDKVACLMQYFGLESRMITMESDLTREETAVVDWEKVRTIWERGRKESEEFILSAISRVEKEKKEPQDYEAFRIKQKYRITYCTTEFRPGYITLKASEEQAEIRKLDRDTLAYCAPQKKRNNGKAKLDPCPFIRKHYRCAGWRLRFKIDRMWFWLLEDGSIKAAEEYDPGRDLPVKIFRGGDSIPYISVNRISAMRADAVWEREPSVFRKLCKKLGRTAGV